MYTRTAPINNGVVLGVIFFIKGNYFILKNVSVPGKFLYDLWAL